ncbi:hypothetical protein VI817_000368 [Penicillium citrinum]|nr:hypothetical protein VI817_000368 [Penicillium citrinum]
MPATAAECAGLGSWATVYTYKQYGSIKDAYITKVCDCPAGTKEVDIYPNHTNEREQSQKVQERLLQLGAACLAS